MTGDNLTLEPTCRNIGQLTDRRLGDGPGISGLGSRLESIATLDTDRLGGRLGRRVVHKHGLSDLVVRLLGRRGAEPAAGGDDDEAESYELTYPPLDETRSDPTSAPLDGVSVPDSPLAGTTPSPIAHRPAPSGSGPTDRRLTPTRAGTPGSEPSGETTRADATASHRQDAYPDSFAGHRASPATEEVSPATGVDATSQPRSETGVTGAAERPGNAARQSPSGHISRRQFDRLTRRASATRTVLVDESRSTDRSPAATQPISGRPEADQSPARSGDSGTRSDGTDARPAPATGDTRRGRLPTVETPSSAVSGASSPPADTPPSRVGPSQSLPRHESTSARTAATSATDSAASPPETASAAADRAVDVATTRVDAPVPTATAPVETRAPPAADSQTTVASDHATRVASLAARSSAVHAHTRFDRTYPEADSPTRSVTDREAGHADVPGVAATTARPETTVSPAAGETQSRGVAAPRSRSREDRTPAGTRTLVRTGDDTRQSATDGVESSPLHRSLATSAAVLDTGAGQRTDSDPEGTPVATVTAVSRLTADATARLDRSRSATATGPSSTMTRSRASEGDVSPVSTPSASDVSTPQQLAPASRSPSIDTDGTAESGAIRTAKTTDSDAAIPEPASSDAGMRRRPTVHSGSETAEPESTARSRPAGVHVPPTTLVTPSPPQSRSSPEAVSGERPRTPTEPRRRGSTPLHSHGRVVTDPDATLAVGPATASPGRSPDAHSRGRPSSEGDTAEGAVGEVDQSVSEAVARTAVVSGVQPTPSERSGEKSETPAQSPPSAGRPLSTTDQYRERPVTADDEWSSASVDTGGTGQSSTRATTRPHTGGEFATPDLEHRTRSVHDVTTAAPGRRAVGSHSRATAVQRLPDSTRRRVTRQQPSSDAGDTQRPSAPRRVAASRATTPGNTVGGDSSVARQETGVSTAGSRVASSGHDVDDPVSEVAVAEPGDVDPVSGAAGRDGSKVDAMSGADADSRNRPDTAPLRRSSAAAHFGVSDTNGRSPAGDPSAGWAGSPLDGATGLTRTDAAVSGVSPGVVERTSRAQSMLGTPHRREYAPVSGDADGSAPSPARVSTLPQSSSETPATSLGGAVDTPRGNGHISRLQAPRTSVGGPARSQAASEATERPTTHDPATGTPAGRSTTPDTGRTDPSPVDAEDRSNRREGVPTSVEQSSPPSESDPLAGTVAESPVGDPRSTNAVQRAEAGSRSSASPLATAVESGQSADETPARRWRLGSLPPDASNGHRSATIGVDTANRRQPAMTGVDAVDPQRSATTADTANRERSAPTVNAADQRSAPTADTANRERFAPGVDTVTRERFAPTVNAPDQRSATSVDTVTRQRSAPTANAADQRSAPTANAADQRSAPTANAADQRSAPSVDTATRERSAPTVNAADQRSAPSVDTDNQQRSVTTVDGADRLAATSIDTVTRQLSPTSVDTVDRQRSAKTTPDPTAGGPRVDGATGRNGVEGSDDAGTETGGSARTDVRRTPPGESAATDGTVDGNAVAGTPSQPGRREPVAGSEPDRQTPVGDRASVGTLTTARDRSATADATATVSRRRPSTEVGVLSTGEKSFAETIKYNREVSEYNVSDDGAHASSTERTTTPEPQTDTSLVYQQGQSTDTAEASARSGSTAETLEDSEKSQSYTAEFPSERAGAAGGAVAGGSDRRGPASPTDPGTGRNGPSDDVFGESSFDSRGRPDGDVGSALSDRPADRSADTTERADSRLRGIDVQLSEQSMQLNADVDRLVDILYRKLERKRRIERQRRGF
ncbi:hypothetical protein NDI56_13950 [Haloarcula sp. S1CR25-12]|uniref:Uncharacterized protein n=1 Tax=Haloarcula saliterrae TaxID=2950534 RepID=A0ABU2FE29_9EURY|nr:hypothetical protein [Haloarcula sp. S1CR25-12]MDS0260504.1 hypothetical protein [Haloarcula sp. S1CR25-12]